MTTKTAELRDYAAELAERARVLEQRAETYHQDNRDKYNHLHGQAFGLRFASEGLAGFLERANQR